jgi:hypothetical protein
MPSREFRQTFMLAGMHADHAANRTGKHFHKISRYTGHFNTKKDTEQTYMKLPAAGANSTSFLFTR